MCEVRLNGDQVHHYFSPGLHGTVVIYILDRKMTFLFEPIIQTRTHLNS